MVGKEEPFMVKVDSVKRQNNEIGSLELNLARNLEYLN